MEITNMNKYTPAAPAPAVPPAKSQITPSDSTETLPPAWAIRAAQAIEIDHHFGRMETQRIQDRAAIIARHAPPAPLPAPSAGGEATIQALRDYIDYLIEGDKMTVGYLHAHNWQYPAEFLKRGEVLRANIIAAAAQPPLPAVPANKELIEVVSPASCKADAPPCAGLVELAKKAIGAAWRCGADEYREGVSDRAVTKNYNEARDAENALFTALANAIAELSRLSAEVAKKALVNDMTARESKDSARLDWLEAHDGDITWGVGVTQVKSTIRETIDAAMGGTT
jgi:hypothetical protein